MSESTADSVSESTLDKIRGEDLLKPTVKFLISVVAIILAQQIVINVEAATGTDVAIPGSTESVTVAEILFSVLTIILVGVIMNYSSSIGEILDEALTEFSGVKKFILILGGLASLLVVYQLFKWVIDYYPPIANEYDLTFLIAGLLLAGWLVVIILFNIDRVFE